MKHVMSSHMKTIVIFLFVILILAIDAFPVSIVAAGEEIQTPTGPMVLIPAGEFTMGTTVEQEQWLKDKG